MLIKPAPPLETQSDLVAESFHLFAKRHRACGGKMLLDLPALPQPPGYRLLVACPCGDTLEEWVDGAVAPRAALLSRLGVRFPSVARSQI